MAAPELYAPRRPAAKRSRPAGRQAVDPARRRGLVYRALTSGVAVAVLGGFGYYAWSAYSGDRTADAAAAGASVVVIEAPDDPLKVPPENPGGIAALGSGYQFFDQMNGERVAVRPDEEFVLPPPEEPIVDLTPEIFDRPPAVPPELTLVSVSSAEEPGADEAEPVPPAAAAGVSVLPVLPDPMQPLPVVEQAALTPDADATLAASSGTASGAQSAIDALVASIASDPAVYAVAAEPAAPAEATPAPPAAAAPAGGAPAGGATVQLASMASQELAQREWERLRRLLPDLLANREPIIRVSTSNDRTYYRISVAAGDRVEAAALCAEIKNRSLDCLVHN